MCVRWGGRRGREELRSAASLVFAGRTVFGAYCRRSGRGKAAIRFVSSFVLLGLCFGMPALMRRKAECSTDVGFLRVCAWFGVFLASALVRCFSRRQVPSLYFMASMCPRLFSPRGRPRAGGGACCRGPCLLARVPRDLLGAPGRGGGGRAVVGSRPRKRARAGSAKGRKTKAPPLLRLPRPGRRPAKGRALSVDTMDPAPMARPRTTNRQAQQTPAMQAT